MQLASGLERVVAVILGRSLLHSQKFSIKLALA